MTESDYTRLVVQGLRRLLPGAVTFKHADLFTMGVPDFSTTLRRCTNWFEAKLLDDRCVKAEPDAAAKPYAVLRPARDVPAVQWETLRRLGRGHLVVYTPRGHALTHVNGFRESVVELRLELVTLEALVRRIAVVADQGEKYNDTEWSGG